MDPFYSLDDVNNDAKRDPNSFGDKRRKLNDSDYGEFLEE